MTEQHPVSSSGENAGAPPDPATSAATRNPADSFPEPGPSGRQPYHPYSSGPPRYPLQPYPPTPHSTTPYGLPPAVPPWRDPLPGGGAEYHRFLRTPRNAWWKGLVAVVGFVFGWLLFNTAFGIVALGFDVATGRSTWEAISTGVLEFTPAVLLATNISNALSIPLAMFVQWAVWGQPVRWLHSVAGVIRWRLLGRSALVVVVIWVVYMAVSTIVSPPGGDSSDPGSFTAESVALLIIMLLTTPLQAAGEEYGARGLIMRAAGSYVASPVPGLTIATLVPSLIFMVAHGAGDPWLNVYYFVFGVAMSMLVWRTGGLEAACVVHAVNNMMSFGIMILAGQEISLDRSAGTGGAFVLVPMAVVVVVTVVLVLLTQRWQVQRTYRPASTGVPSPGVGSPAAVVPVIEGKPTH